MFFETSPNIKVTNKGKCVKIISLRYQNFTVIPRLKKKKKNMNKTNYWSIWMNLHFCVEIIILFSLLSETIKHNLCIKLKWTNYHNFKIIVNILTFNSWSINGKSQVFKQRNVPNYLLHAAEDFSFWFKAVYLFREKKVQCNGRQECAVW